MICVNSWGGVQRLNTHFLLRRANRNVTSPCDKTKELKEKRQRVMLFFCWEHPTCRWWQKPRVTSRVMTGQATSCLSQLKATSGFGDHPHVGCTTKKTSQVSFFFTSVESHGRVTFLFALQNKSMFFCRSLSSISSLFAFIPWPQGHEDPCPKQATPQVCTTQ